METYFYIAREEGERGGTGNRGDRGDGGDGGANGPEGDVRDCTRASCSHGSGDPCPPCPVCELTARMEGIRSQLLHDRDELRRSAENLILREHDLVSAVSRGGSDDVMKLAAELVEAAQQQVERAEQQLEQTQTLFMALLTARDQVMRGGGSGTSETEGVGEVGRREAEESGSEEGNEHSRATAAQREATDPHEGDGTVPVSGVDEEPLSRPRASSRSADVDDHVLTRARSPLSKFVVMSPSLSRVRRKFKNIRASPVPSRAAEPQGGSEMGDAGDPRAQRKHERVLQLLAYVPRSLHWHLLKHKENRHPASYCKETMAAVLFADISGFTSLMESASALGVAGFERVSLHLNNYFSRLISICLEHGGDVLKFAGDALIVMFRVHYIEHSPSLAIATQRALQCAVDMQERQALYESGDLVLSLHVAVSAGALFQLHVGGIKGCWEFLVAGDAVRQLQTAVDASKPGQVVLSPEAYEQCKHRAVCVQIESNDFLVKGIIDPVEVQGAQRIAVDVMFESALRSYIPKGVLERVDAGQNAWLGECSALERGRMFTSYSREFRTVTVLFVKLDVLKFSDGAESSTKEEHKALHRALCAMQRVLFRFEGSIRQLLVDDKGTVLIAVFGIPPFSHEDDPMRGCRSALLVRQGLFKLGCYASIGITTGRVFCGAVGCETRREYAVVGDVVNLSKSYGEAAYKESSARLMGAAKDVGILCDEATYLCVKDVLVCQELAPVRVKGKRNLVKIYRPHPMTAMSEVAALSTHSSSREDTEFWGNAHVVSCVRRKIVLFQQGVHHLRIGDSTAAKAEEVEYPSGGLLFVEGARGFGKSKLLRVASALCATHDVEVCIVDAKADIDIVMGMWRTLVLQLYECETLGSEEQQAIILSALSKCSSKLLSRASVLNAVFGFNVGPSARVKSVDKVETVQRLLGELIKQSFGQEPFMLLVDNVHKLGGESLLMLEHVLLELPFIPIIGTSLPVSSGHVLSSISRACLEVPRGRLELRAFSDDEVRQCVSDLLEVRHVDSGFVAEVQRLTGGVPLFVMLFTGELMETRSIATNAQNCAVLSEQYRERNGIGVPDSIRALIQSAIDELHPNWQLLLKVCSFLHANRQPITIDRVLRVFPVATTGGDIAEWMLGVERHYLLHEDEDEEEGEGEEDDLNGEEDDGIPGDDKQDRNELPPGETSATCRTAPRYSFRSLHVQDVCFQLLPGEQTKLLMQRLKEAL